MLEKTIEKYLVQQTRAVGGLALKWVSPGQNGVPDRIVFFPGGRIVFVEVKAPGKKPTELQRRMHQHLEDLGFIVLVIDSIDEVKKFISIYNSPQTEETMSIFSLPKTGRLNVKTLPNGRFQAFVADEDGAVVLHQDYPTFREAANAVHEVQKSLAELRKNILGVESLAKLREQYRAAKDEADRLRDLFVAAKAGMAESKYLDARNEI